MIGYSQIAKGPRAGQIFNNPNPIKAVGSPKVGTFLYLLASVTVRLAWGVFVELFNCVSKIIIYFDMDIEEQGK